MITVAHDPTIAPATIDEISRRIPWVTFVPVADIAATDLNVDMALAAGPDLFLLDALERALPTVVATSEETRRYMRDGGGVLTADDPKSLADGVKRVATMAPAARRVMGRIGRNHLLNLVA